MSIFRACVILFGLKYVGANSFLLRSRYMYIRYVKMVRSESDPSIPANVFQLERDKEGSPPLIEYHEISVH